MQTGEMIESRGHSSAPVQWMSLTIDCPDPGTLADFYAAALGGEVTRRTAEAAFVRAPELALVFRADPNHRPPTWPSPEIPLHTHFELVVDDPDDAAETMLRLGASMAAHQDSSDPHIVVMLDPAGHPFCLIRSSKARRP